MAQIKVETGKARRTYPRKLITGYTYVKNDEYEILECGHLCGTGWSATQVASFIGDHVHEDTHRTCRECEPLKPKKPKGKQAIKTKIV